MRKKWVGRPVRPAPLATSSAGCTARRARNTALWCTCAITGAIFSLNPPYTTTP
nr:MAG TPA: hypothetical protein [Caudoviricetes sp.]